MITLVRHTRNITAVPDLSSCVLLLIGSEIQDVEAWMAIVSAKLGFRARTHFAHDYQMSGERERERRLKLPVFSLFLLPLLDNFWPLFEALLWNESLTRRKQAILLSQGSHALSQNVSKVYFLFPKLGKRTWFPVHVVWETSTWLSSVALNFLVLSHLLDRFTNPISALKLIKKCQNYLEIFSREKVSGSLRPKFIWGRVWAYDRNFNEFDFRFSSHFPPF